jgi:hypothetical protein
MKHFSIWQWTNYVRGVGDAAERVAMDTHLASGCSRCEPMVNVLRGVTAAAVSEAGYEPPEYALRYASAIYSLYKPENTSLPRLIARLVHDSVREPLPAGMRGHDRLSRHALYEAGNYCLDLQLEQQPASGLVTLIGQLADRNTPTSNIASLPVWLMERKKLVASTLCNDFGEFQLEYTPARHLSLQLPLGAEQRRLEVPLDRLAPEPPKRIQSAKSRPAGRKK